MSKRVQATYRCTLLILVVLLSSCGATSHAGQPVVFVINGTGTVNYNDTANLLAFDAHGEKRWQIPTNLYAMPLIGAANVDYIPIRTPGVQDTLLAIDTTTGKERWRVPMHTFVAEKVTGTLMPLLAKSAVIVPGQTAILAFALSDGHLLWQHPIGDLVRQPVIIDNSVVIAATYKGPSAPCSDAKVEALDMSNGQALWSYTKPGVPTTPILSDDLKTIFFSTYYDTCGGSFSGSETALNMSAGTVLWQTHQSYFANDFHGANGLIWAFTNDNNSSQNDGASVTAFRSSDGSIAWRYKIKGPISNIVASNGMLIFNEVHNDDKEPAVHMHLVALHISDGSVGWHVDPQQRLYGDNDLESGSLIAINGTVGALVGTQTYPNGEAKDAQLVIYNASDGHILHSTTVGINPSYLTYGQGMYYAITKPPLDHQGDMATLTAIQANNGSILWRAQLFTPVSTLLSI